MELPERAIELGGHKGMRVWRTPAGILKSAICELDDQLRPVYDLNATALANEAALLHHLASDYVPKLISCGPGWLLQQDLGDHEPPTDGEALRRNMVWMLAWLRWRGVRHGDLTGPNVILHNNRPALVDWQEGHFLTEPAPQKSPHSDSYFVCRYLSGTAGPDGHADTPRIARRWLAVLDSLGCTMVDPCLPMKDKTFLDIGCFQGDFVALAASEGMLALGIDPGGFRSGENAIEIGRDLWRGFPPIGIVKMEQGDVFDFIQFDNDVVMMFSTWPYLVQQKGRAEATALLARIIKECGVFFFETQLYGDGPGPDFHRTDEDVGNMLAQWGSVEKLVTIPVTGRPASRTVWRVK